MVRSNKKILFSTLINVFGVLLAWNIEILNTRNYNLKNVVENFANDIQGFSSSGMVVMVPILIVIALLDYFYTSNKPKHIYLLLFLQWILLSAPFFYWSVKSTYNRNVNILIIVVFLCIQLIKYWVIQRHYTKYRIDQT